MALAAASPTSSAPMRPGPCVVAMAARSSQPTPAALIASATTSFTSSVWRREATSGTTPPNCACSSFCDDTMDERTSRPRTTAALVSSHEVSTHRRGPAGVRGREVLSSIVSSQNELHAQFGGAKPPPAPRRRTARAARSATTRWTRGPRGPARPPRWCRRTRSRRTEEARRAGPPRPGREPRGRSCAVPFPVLPHDDGVLAIVAVVAGTHAGGDEAEAPVQLDARRVGDAHLERVPAVPLTLGDREVGLQQLGGDVLAAVRLVHGDAHEVPDVHEHVGDDVAGDPPAELADEVDSRLAGQLAVEDGQRPWQRERAAVSY